MKLSKGMRVMIYEDPITMKCPEGEAVLIKRIAVSKNPNIERWVVRFVDDQPEDGTYTRMIYIEDQQ